MINCNLSRFSVILKTSSSLPVQRKLSQWCKRQMRFHSLLLMATFPVWPSPYQWFCWKQRGCLRLNLRCRPRRSNASQFYACRNTLPCLPLCILKCLVVTVCAFPQHSVRRHRGLHQAGQRLLSRGTGAHAERTVWQVWPDCKGGSSLSVKPSDHGSDSQIQNIFLLFFFFHFNEKKKINRLLLN